MAHSSQGGTPVYEAWSAPEQLRDTSQQLPTYSSASSARSDAYTDNWEGLSHSTEQSFAYDSQGSYSSASSSQEQLAITTKASHQPDSAPPRRTTSLVDAFAPSAGLSFAHPHHSHASATLPGAYDTQVMNYSADGAHPAAYHADLGNLGGIAEGDPALMEGMTHGGWEQSGFYGSDDGVRNTSTTASSPTDQFAFASNFSPPCLASDVSPLFDDPRSAYASPTSSTYHTPSSSASSLAALGSNPTSPSFAPPIQGRRSRQQSLDSVSRPVPGRPSLVRRMSQPINAAQYTPYGVPFPAVLAPPPRRPRPLPTASRSFPSLTPSSTTRSIFVLPAQPSSNSRPNTDQPTTTRPRALSSRSRSNSPIVENFPSSSPYPNPRSRRTSQSSSSHGLTIAPTPFSHIRMRDRSSSSASSSPVSARFPGFAFPPPVAFTPQRGEEGWRKPPAPCSLFDAPWVRRFGDGEKQEQGMDLDEQDGQRRVSEGVESLLVQGTMGLGLDLGPPAGEQMSTEMGVVQEGERCFAPGMTSDLLAETMAYLEAANKFARGERTILIFSPKLILSSLSDLGFSLLHPQPSIRLLGTEWCSDIVPTTPTTSQQAIPRHRAAPPPLVVEPLVHVGTSTTDLFHRRPLNFEWMGEDGWLVPLPKEGVRVVAGRAVAEGVGAVGASLGEEVRPLVAVLAQGEGPPAERIIGAFPGAPMVVAEQGEVIQHGALVAIGSTVTTSTSLTPFLAASGTAVTFPTYDWRASTGGLRRPYRTKASDLTTRPQGEWDAFIIYAVDPQMSSVESEGVTSREKGRAYRAGYPPPPLNALSYDSLRPASIHYNQPVVLQSMSTASLSPTLVIRRRATNPLSPGFSHTVHGGPFDPTTFTFEDHLPRPADPLFHPDGRFEGRILGVSKNGPVSHVTGGQRVYIGAREGVGATPSLRTAGVGGGARLMRRTEGVEEEVGNEKMAPRLTPWTVECGERCLWTIMPVDVARHTFFIPPSLPGAKRVQCNADGSPEPHSNTALVPSIPLGPAIPTVYEYDPPTPSQPLITLYGANLTPSLSIYFGTHRAPTYHLISPSILRVAPPPWSTPDTPTAGQAPKGKRIALGREDGVVWMTHVLYREGGM